MLKHFLSGNAVWCNETDRWQKIWLPLCHGPPNCLTSAKSLHLKIIRSDYKCWRSYHHSVSSLCRRGIWGSREATFLQPQKSRIQAYLTHGGLLPLVMSLLSWPQTSRKANLETRYAVSVSVICYKAIDLHQIFISHFWWLEGQDEVLTELMSGEDTLRGLQMLFFSLHLHMSEREIIFLVFPLIRALIPFVRAPPSWPNYLPNAPPPDTITLWVRISIWVLWEHKQSVHNMCGSLRLWYANVENFNMIF